MRNNDRLRIHVIHVGHGDCILIEMPDRAGAGGRQVRLGMVDAGGMDADVKDKPLGYLTALLAGLCDDPDFVVPMVPPACFGDLAWRFFTETRHYRKGGAPALSREELRAAFRIHSPLAHPLRVPKRQVLIIAGRGDRIVPPEHPAALWQHWGQPDVHWFSGSHLAPFGRRRIVDAIVRHLESLDIL